MLYSNSKTKGNIMDRWLGLMVALPLYLALSTAAQAHPHSFIDMDTEIISQQEQITGLKMTWTMDEITSTDLFYDAGDAKPGSVTWKKLAAQVMANVLGQHYFTEIYRDGRPVKFLAMPAEYRLSRQDLKATLEFVLPLAHPLPLAGGPLRISTFDPTYFVAMSYRDRSAIRLPEALSGRCQMTLNTPRPNASLKAYALSLDQAGSPGVDMALGKQFAQEVTLQCH